MIPYGKQDISDDDIDAVIKVLKSDFVTQGPKVPEFENSIKKYCNVKKALAVNSATSGLHIACLALGVGSGDTVWTSSVTFAASSNCALYCGANVDFIDIDPCSYNLSTQDLEEKLRIAKKNKALPKVVIPVHLTGQSCDMKKIYELSKEYNFKIIEDASHAIGGEYNGKKIGSCEYSDITVFSFHPVKIITTGEGGMVTTNDEFLAEKMNLYRTHGITRDSNIMQSKFSEPWYYEQLNLGLNYRLTDIQAALGLSQMKRLDSFICKRREIAKRYDLSLSKLPIRLPAQAEDVDSSWHLYVIRVNKDSHRAIFEFLRNNGVGVNLHYIPVYKHPYYTSLGFKKDYCTEAEKYYSEAISIPIYSKLTFDEQDFVVQTLKTAIDNQ
jgi:UDP-4-amino-4,6-dideoxy-N-acetyl-beta-L-altrosamine transaminase